MTRPSIVGHVAGYAGSPPPVDLGTQEQAVLDAVTANPFAGQHEIAAAIGIARSTVAAHIVNLTRKGRIIGRGYMVAAAQRIVCFGGMVLDRKYHLAAPLVAGTSNPVEGTRSYGGVARNVAENLARLGCQTSLVSIVGDDQNGRDLVRALRDLGIDGSGIAVSPDRATAEYAAVLDPDHNLAVGLADMGIFDSLNDQHLERSWPHFAAAAFVFVDCNVPAALIAAVASRRQSAKFRLGIDAVSTAKARRLPADLTGIDVLFCNRDEAVAYLQSGPDDPESLVHALRRRGAAEVVLTLGAEGALHADDGGLSMIPAIPAHPVDVTGAGDAMIAGTLSRLLDGDTTLAAVRTGALLAALTTETAASVHPDLSPGFLQARRAERGAAETTPERLSDEHRAHSFATGDQRRGRPRAEPQPAGRCA